MTGSDPTLEQTAAKHLAFGWWLVVASIALGTALEALHALKLGVYLDVANETRRLLWTLAHAHGALLGLVHVAFATSLPKLAALSPGGRTLASRALGAGSLLLPAGFFLGGVFVYEGDPGLGVLLAPVGAALVLVAVVVIALGARRRGRA
ncbi:MAG: hypothetical protein IPK00_06880 [Deltaproteobacteria bacterium]|nr:hypothetical protein [Deltaproteobacteria bacterium]